MLIFYIKENFQLYLIEFLEERENVINSMEISDKVALVTGKVLLAIEVSIEA